MMIKINKIEITDVQFLTDSECRDVIGELAMKQDLLSPREQGILDAADDRVQDNDLRDFEPIESLDLSDDGDALASAGWCTDEDYGTFDSDMEW